MPYALSLADDIQTTIGMHLHIINNIQPVILCAKKHPHAYADQLLCVVCCRKGIEHVMQN